MSNDKGPIPDTKEMLIKVIFMVVDDLILMKKLRQQLVTAKKARGEPTSAELEPQGVSEGERAKK